MDAPHSSTVIWPNYSVFVDMTHHKTSGRNIYIWKKKTMKRGCLYCACTASHWSVCTQSADCVCCCCRLQRLWEEEVAKVGLEKASLVRVILRFQRTRLILSVLVGVLAMVIVFLGPVSFHRCILFESCLHLLVGSNSFLWGLSCYHIHCKLFLIKK